MNKFITVIKSFTKYKIPFPFIDIYLFKWNPKTNTKIHNHSKNGCLMFILNGCLNEEVFSKNFCLKNKNTYNTGNISYINDSIGYHKIINNTDKNSYSIHLYHPKNHITKYYD